jgi:hypothetical protein
MTFDKLLKEAYGLALRALQGMKWVIYALTLLAKVAAVVVVITIIWLISGIIFSMFAYGTVHHLA